MQGTIAGFFTVLFLSYPSDAAERSTGDNDTTSDDWPVAETGEERCAASSVVGNEVSELLGTALVAS